LFEAAGDRLMAAETLVEEARAFYLLDDPRTLLRALQALHLCEHLHLNQPDLMLRILIHTGIVYYKYGDWAKAIEFGDRALECVRQDPNLRLLARTHTILAGCHLQLGNHSTAVDHARRAYALFCRSVDPTDMARAENNLGFTYVRVGRFPDAERHLTRALELIEQDPTSGAFLRADVLCGLAELHLARNELEAAEARLAQASEVAEQRDERAGQAYVTHLTARLRLLRGEFHAADAAFAGAVALFETLGRTNRLAECHSEHARALERQGRMEEAIDHMRAAYEAVTAGPSKLAAAMLADVDSGAS
jgi:tetratricopeptide (TPR) repeat protein